MDKRNKEILKIALPSIVSNITVPLLGLVDVAIVGHLGAAAYIGAIAVGGMMFNVMYWIFSFLRMGTSGMTSQALGRRDLCEVTRLLARSAGIAFAVAAALILLQKPLLAAALGIMQPTEEVAHLASVYFLTLIYGAPAMLGLFSLSGWFIGMQNSRSPMAVAIVQNVVNICASTFLVFGCGMKVEGVAFGTLTAQYAGFIMAVALCWRHYRRLRAYFSWQGVWRRDDMRRFFSVNRDIFLRTLCMVSVMPSLTPVRRCRAAISVRATRQPCATRCATSSVGAWRWPPPSPWFTASGATLSCRCSPTSRRSLRHHTPIIIGHLPFRWPEWRHSYGTGYSSAAP